MLESSEDEIIFVAAVAATVTPPRERRQIGVLRPRAVSSEGDEYFLEVVGWKIERGREYFLIKWAGYSDDYNTWENGQEKRLEIPNMVADYYDELDVTDDEENFDNSQDITCK